MNIDTKNLKKGDIILYHGNHPLSRLIRYFDESTYNHCSIYDEDGFVYEAEFNGVVRRPLTESIEISEAILVTHWRLEDAPNDMTPIINTIKTYTNTHYSVSQLLLLATVLLKRKLTNNKSLFSFTHQYLLYAIDELETLIDKNNNGFMCSELVYRAFNTQENSNFHIKFTHQKSLRNAPKALFKFLKKPKKVHQIKTTKAKAPIIEAFENYKTKKETLKGLTSRVSNDINAALLSKNPIDNYNKNKELFTKSNAKIDDFLNQINLSNFITPGDIERSINLKKQGELLTIPKSDWLYDVCN